MMTTLEEFTEQWKVLIQHQQYQQRQTHQHQCLSRGRRRRRQRQPAPAQPLSVTTATTKDPYDCRDMAIPDVYEKVNEMLPSFVQSWRNLDERKIGASMMMIPTTTNNSSSSSPSKRKLTPTTKTSKSLGEGRSQDIHLEEDDNSTTTSNVDDDVDVKANEDQLPSAKNDDKKKKRARTTTVPDDDGEGGNGVVVLTKKPYWYEKHVRLPENFDYTNQRSEPPPLEARDYEDGVVSLMNPLLARPTTTTTTTARLSYEHELWQLFRSVPTSTQLQQDDDDDDLTRKSTTTTSRGKTSQRWMTLPHTRALHETISEQLTSRQGTNTTLASSKYGLYALRMRDRHDFPQWATVVAAPPDPELNNAFNEDEGDDGDPSKSVDDVDDDGLEEEATEDDHCVENSLRPPLLHVVGTITLELWRKPCDDQSQPTPDSSRMVLEFLGTQSLLDVHSAIVDLTQDRFWNQVQAAAAARSRNVDDAHDYNASDKSGYFFIEGTFYTTGQVDYVTPIRNWLASGPVHKRTHRA